MKDSLGQIFKKCNRTPASWHELARDLADHEVGPVLFRTRRDAGMPR